MADLVLVHSPLVGPSTWRWVAGELAALGHHVTVPAVAPAVAARGWEAFADSVAEQTADRDHGVLVGHSGAGPLLPQIAGRARWRADALVFVDAAVPPERGEAELMPERVLAELRPLAADGLLPPWSDWFGPGVMAELIPDEEKRAAVSAELPLLPLAYFEGGVPVPAGWASAPCGYLLLSAAYAEEAAKAQERGWPAVRQLGAHLDIVTQPRKIADAILALTRSVQAS
jgi:pimeloyl-ACP methyl ester carboxylesterase